ncbi:MAG: OmpW family outer membrane protein [Pseudomonadota bacterium]
MQKVLAALAITASSIAISSGVAAADDGFFTRKSDGDWLVRLRAISVTPNDDSELSAGGVFVDHSVDTSVVPELDITYFFTENLAAELILATTPHEITATTLGARVGEVWLLPPTLTLQYHFTDFGAVKPYVGAGVNYTIFYGKNETLPFDIDNSFGWALQAGLDFEIEEGLYLNADVKRLFLSPEVNVAGGAVTGEAGIDPWIFGVGLGVRF